MESISIFERKVLAHMVDLDIPRIHKCPKSDEGHSDLPPQEDLCSLGCSFGALTTRWKNVLFADFLAPDHNWGPWGCTDLRICTTGVLEKTRRWTEMSSATNEPIAWLCLDVLEEVGLLDSLDLCSDLRCQSPWELHIHFACCRKTTVLHSSRQE